MTHAKAKRRLTLVFSVVVVILLNGDIYANGVSSSERSNYVKHGAYSTKLAIYYQLAITGNYSTETITPDISGLLFQLGTTDDDVARKSLVELIDVYVGESHLNALLVAVTLHGKKILPMLKNKRQKTPVSQCKQPERTREPNITWCLNEDQVINRLDRIIDYIEAGKTPEYIW